MRSTTDAFVCSENSAMLECIRMRRESRLSNMRERSYHTNPIEHLHAGHEFVDRESASKNADGKSECGELVPKLARVLSVPRDFRKRGPDSISKVYTRMSAHVDDSIPCASSPWRLLPGPYRLPSIVFHSLNPSLSDKLMSSIAGL